jgi:Cation transport ATPase
MSCANCAATVEDALGDRAGVREANVNYATDEGTVTYDPDEVSLRALVDAVEAAGYDVVTDAVTVGIADMTCAKLRGVERGEPPRHPPASSTPT